MDKLNRKISISKAIITFLFLFVSLTGLFPFIFMLSSSLKNAADVFAYPFQLISDPLVLTNYPELFSPNYYFVRWYTNTIVMVAVTLAFRMVVVGITAYSLSKLRYKGRDTLFLLFMVTLMIPGDQLLVPRYIVLSILKLTDTMWSMVFLYTFEFFLVFLVRQSYLSIPDELSEAAIIDGCSHFRVYFNIILPLSKPVMVTMAIFTFVWQWNDFTNPFIFINDSTKTMISVGISKFATEHTVNYALQMAGASLTLLPVIIVYLFTQRYFIQGVATSGIKG